MNNFKRNFWMAALMSGAMAFSAGPAFGAPAPRHHSHSQSSDHQGAMSGHASLTNEGVSSMGKLQQADAHTLWLLHKIDQSEIAAAQIAKAKSQNDKVKDLADELLKDHQDLENKVTKLAQDNNVVFEGAASGQSGQTGMTGQGGSGSAGASVQGLGTGSEGASGNTQGTAGSAAQNLPSTPAEPLPGNSGERGLGSPQPTVQNSQQAQSQGKQTDQNGASSTVEVIPNSGTGGSGSANAQAGASAGTSDQNARAQAGVSGQAGTGGAGMSAQAGTQGQAMQLSSSDKRMLRHGNEMLQRLTSLSGSRFDRAFVRGMVRDHQKAISMLQKEKPQNSDLESLVKDTLPTLQKHEKDARSALGSLGGQARESQNVNRPQHWAPNQTGTETGTGGSGATDNQKLPPSTSATGQSAGGGSGAGAGTGPAGTPSSGGGGAGGGAGGGGGR